MKKNIFINPRWDTLISLIIWVFIISLIVFWIINLLGFNYAIEGDFVYSNKIFFLKNNTYNILKKLNLSTISEGETFYIYKNKENSTFDIMTWALSENYKYINEFWDYISNTWSYEQDLFSRVIVLQKSDKTIWEENQITNVIVNKINK